MIARIRTVKPEFFTHGDLFDLEMSTAREGVTDTGATILSAMPIRLSFEGLWCCADREGRFEWKPRELKLAIVPYDECDFSLVLDTLASKSFIVRYAVGGKMFGVIPSFKRHQRVNPKEAQSVIPEPPADVLAIINSRHGLAPEIDGATSGDDVDSDENVSGLNPDVYGTEQNGTEQNGTERSKSVALALVGSSTKNGATPPLPAIRGKATMDAVRDRLALVVAEIQSGTRRRVTKEQTRRLQAELVFAYWAAKMGHDKTILDDKRERAIVKQLDVNDGDVNELLYVVDGALKDDWIMGRDAKSTKKYDGTETLFRDRAQVERLASNVKKYRDGLPHPMATKYGTAINGEVASETTDAKRDERAGDNR